MYITTQAVKEGEIHTQTLLGTEYTVIPVIAMVEGVRIGANSQGAELGLASEFGKMPVTWNSKPVVLNHPKIGNNYVSANTPDILEEYFLGSIMNTKLVDNKLHMEAWLNTSLADKNDEFKAMFDRVLSGEVVEISVGMYVDAEESSGTYNGETYEYVWRNVLPDHLALLSTEIGACSVANGCGTNRIQTSLQKGADMLKTLAGYKDKDKKKKEPELAAECACEDKKPSITAEAAMLQHITQSISNELLSGDIYKLLSTALSSEGNYPYIIGYTTDYVIYEAWSDSDDSWNTYRRAVSIDSEGVVTFTSEPEAVALITKINPLNNQTTENNMTDELENKTAETPAATTPAATTETPAATTTSPAEVTVEQYIANAPKAIADVLAQSLKTQAEAKAAAIQSLKATNRCTFSDATLAAMSLDELKAMQTLANVPSFEGRAAPAPTTNAAANEIPRAPSVSERLKAQAAAKAGK